MQKKLAWIFSIGAFVGGFLICLYVFVKKDYPFSQNTFYHIQFARTYAKGIWNFADLGILSQSYFDKVFVDQHLLYHFYLIPFLIFFSPFVATKIAMSVLLGTVVLLLQRLLQQYATPFKALIFALVFLFLSGNAMSRIFWERPAPFNFIAILSILLLSRRMAAPWMWALLGYLFSLVSFETAFVTVSFGAFFLFDFKKTPWKFVLALFLGVAASFILVPFPLQKIQYFAHLLYYNLFVEAKIREWQSVREPTEVLGLFLVLFLISFLWGWLKKKDSTAILSLRNRLAILSGILLFAGLQVSRLGYFFCLISFILFILVNSEFEAASPKRFIKWGVNCLLLGFVILSMNSVVTMRKSFRGDSGTVRDLRKFAVWFNQSEYRDQHLFLMSWEYWSPLFYYDRNTKAEPGFSMFIYDQKDPKLTAKTYLFWERPEAFTWPELRDLFSSWNSKLLLIEKSHRSYNAIKTNLPFLKKVYEDDKFELLQAEPPLKLMVLQDEELCRDVLNSKGKLPENTFIALNLKQLYSPQILKNAPSEKSFVVIREAEKTDELASSLHPFLEGRYLYWDKEDKRFLSSRNMVRSKKDYKSFQLYRAVQCNRINGQIATSRPGLNPERKVESFLREGLKDSLNLLSAQTENNLGTMPYLFEEDQKYVDNSGSSNIRNHLAIWSLCEQKDLFLSEANNYSRYAKDCEKSLHAAYKNMNSSQDHKLGEWATLGFSYISLYKTSQWNEQLAQEFASVHQQILSYYQSEDIPPASDLFSYGEGLLYLLKTPLEQKQPVEKLLQAYWDDYQATKNIFYIRWLSESLAIAQQKFKNPLYSERLKEIFDETTNQWISWSDSIPDLKGCPYGALPGSTNIMNPHHIGGLFLEGFTAGLSLKDPQGRAVIDSQKVTEMLSCIARLQRTEWNLPFTGNKPTSLGGIPLGYENPTLRSDLQGHVTTAMARFFKWEHGQ